MAADAPARRDLIPSSAIPIAYFACAHAGFAAALLVLVLRPDLPGPFYYHPTMVALVHLVTVAWLSGSILGAFYIVAPLALGLAMPVRWLDWAAFIFFVLGTSGLVSHFWIGEYDGMAWAAGMIVLAIAHVAFRAFAGLPRARAPWPVKLHVALAFINVLIAAVMGIVIGLNRTRGFWSVSPLAAAYAHLHLAAIGWVTMMVVGLAYRLIPMMLPAQMPTGPRLALSAVLIESGLAVLVVALLEQSAWTAFGAALIVAGLVSFVVQIRGTLAHRMPRPVGLPARDWSAWQTHIALLWLVVAAALGLAVAIGVPERWRIAAAWTYGGAGLVGFLAQIVTGIQGRLVPLYSWYRTFAARGGAPPERSAHELPSPAFARLLFLTWGLGVPGLLAGLVTENKTIIAVFGAVLLAAVAVGGAYLRYLLQNARRPRVGETHDIRGSGQV